MNKIKIAVGITTITSIFMGFVPYIILCVYKYEFITDFGQFEASDQIAILAILGIVVGCITAIVVEFIMDKWKER